MPNQVVLRLDDVGRKAAQQHIEEDRRAAEEGVMCDIPLEQVPEFVLEYWERNGRL